MNKVVVYAFDDLVGLTDPITVKDDWIHIVFENLKRGEYYAVPLLLWASKERPISVRIYKAGSSDRENLALSRSFILGPNKDYRDRPQWTTRRYKLDGERHDGEARIDVGWDHNGSPSRGDTEFQIFANALTSKKITRLHHVEAGECPECGEPGQWQAMAMVCLEHGPFIG